MLRNHLKFSTRVFLKDKFFSVPNILGLAMGIAVSIILPLILQNDLTYDKHFLNHETFIGLEHGALLFTFLTVSFHSMKTATTNPVESLKYE
ncbi:MAG TPA: hypothetical protein VFW11_19825 [Cyclobacteriaceae bacterium]|nr:hypothetical protein [Cyclobacteriaceae bacterium]